MKAVVTIRTWKKAENPTTWKKFEEATVERFLFEAEDLYHAELKVLESFPAEKCIGFNISMENGDFTCQQVKDCYFYEGKNSTDEEIKAMLILGVKKTIQNNLDVKAGRKRWVETYNGDYILVDVKKEVA